MISFPRTPKAITDVHWWGSYEGGTGPKAINGFAISFYVDAPAGGTEPFSHPGTLLQSYYISGNCNESYYGYSASDGTDVYKYDVILPTPFAQVYGTTYWLSIQVDQGWGAPPSWGWHNSYNHWNDNAVQATGEETWSRLSGQDLAFMLTVPEPVAVGLLGLGALSVLRRRSRKHRIQV